MGIISYMPDDEEIRKARYSILLQLLDTCYRFNAPIMIIAQNWNEEELNNLKDKVILKTYPKLGITGARKELRKQFLASNFDYLIMLDDDCKLRATDKGIAIYLNKIDMHPGGVGEFRSTLLKLYAISKEIFSQVDYEDISPENGEGFEDTIFANKVRAQFHNKLFSFQINSADLLETSKVSKDTLSTWYTNQNLPEMLGKTHELIDKKFKK